MKKYLFGLSAIVLAIGFSSFTIAKRQTNVIFEYQKATFAKLDVENRAKTSWKVTTNLTCNSTNTKACEIEVDPLYTTTDAQGDVVLKTSGPDQVTLVGTASSGTIHFVDAALSSNLVQVFNKN